MTLFDGLAPADGDATIEGAARRLTDAVAALEAPRSLCEAGADEHDYAWLLEWAQGVSPYVLEKWTHAFGDGGIVQASIPLRRTEAIGVLLLLLAAESARRDAREGYVWSVVQDRFGPEARRQLFQQGQPVHAFKSALEVAAVRLRLRHVFGIEGTQNYYVTVYLQFGFTRKGLAQLPYWLAGHAKTEAVGALLSGEMRSRSFQQLWHALREYRRAHILESRARQSVADSRWVLAEWTDELLGRAREKLELGTASSDQVGTVADTSVSFLDTPRLRWKPPDEPRFVCRLANLAALDLSTSRYEVLSGGRVLGTLLRQPDESYAGSEAIELPAVPAQQVISLVDDTSVELATQVVDLWEMAEEVNLFELASGRRVQDASGERLSPEREYALLTAAGLTVAPEPVVWRRIAPPAPAPARCLTYLARGWPVDLRVLLGGEVLWQPYVGVGRLGPQVAPRWTENMHVECDPPREAPVGNPVLATIAGLTGELEVTSVRLDAEPLEFAREGDRVSVAPVELTPVRALGPLKLAIGLQRGAEHARIERALPIEPVGVARLGEGGWEVLRQDQTLTTDDARQHTFRSFLPRRVGRDIATPSLFEGFTYLSRLSPIPRPFGELSGFGTDLRVFNRPYNADQVILRISRAVTAPGLIERVERCGDRTCCIVLQRPLEPEFDGGHMVLRWTLGEKPTKVPASRLRAGSSTTWEISGTTLDPGRTLVAISYRGSLLGTWWPADLGARWQAPPPATVRPRVTAAWVRWLRLPILQESCLPAFRAFARLYPGETLTAWILDRGLPEQLNVRPATDAWLEAVRRIFWRWSPTKDDVADIVLAVGRSLKSDQLLATTLGALEFDPLLVWRLLRAWPAELPLDADSSSWASLLPKIRRELTGLPDRSTDADVRRREAEILAEAAQLMHCDPNFLERGIVQRALAVRNLTELPVVHARNLRIALGVAGFRQYLLVRALSERDRLETTTSHAGRR